MSMLIDTHAHLDQAEFDSDRTSVLQRAQDAGVETMLAVGTTATSSARCVELAAEFPLLRAAVGIQPNYVHEAAPEDWDKIVHLAERAEVVALGETGLDRYWDFAPFELQQDYFDRHLRLSQQTGLPVVIHLRDCEEDILAMLREARRRGPVAGVMHSYTGSIAGAAESVELGLYISFAGMVTFKKSDELRACAASVPADRILIETDSPYLSPEPVRKIKRNEPAHVRHTAARLAEVRGLSLEDFAALTTANARRLFHFA
ncbi:MAG: TatD family hydrolase [Planctomycetales bacterium]|nr:TatD family hydrolase [Planctomycetales bacterium]